MPSTLSALGPSVSYKALSQTTPLSQSARPEPGYSQVPQSGPIETTESVKRIEAVLVWSRSAKSHASPLLPCDPPQSCAHRKERRHLYRS